ncbi:MAG: hypothetical protein Q9169_007284 [Polycauliona sp. 2 TL-2023]
MTPAAQRIAQTLDAERAAAASDADWWSGMSSKGTIEQEQKELMKAAQALADVAEVGEGQVAGLENQAALDRETMQRALTGQEGFEDVGYEESDDSLAEEEDMAVEAGGEAIESTMGRTVEEAMEEDGMEGVAFSG